MSGQRARSSVTADHRSAHPNIAGIPWWGAVLTTVIASLVGFAFDAGSGGGQLTTVFTALYVIGCLIAVLAVAQSGLFTAIIQPPLVLFVTVPSAYFLMHSGEIQGIKDVLINCGYPLIERFPLMFFTSATVLLIGLARWYFGKSVRAAAPEETDAPAKARSGGLSSKLSSKLSSLLGGTPAAENSAETPRERRAAQRRRTAAAKPAAERAARSARPTKGAASRSRHSRNPETEIIEPVAERPRRRRPRPADAPPESEPRRRPRSTSREPREPRERRAYDRDGRYERQRTERSERPGRPERSPRPDVRSRSDDYMQNDYRHDDYDPRDTYGTSTHHPISRVRYRGDDPVDQPEYRPRRRPQRDADRWEYDI